MKINKVLVILGEPQSTFSEILFKYFNSKEFLKNKKKIILIGSMSLLEKQMKKLKFNSNFKLINNIDEANNNKLNIINVNYNSKKIFSKISSDSRKYITNCFKVGFNLIKNNKKTVLINGPVSKKHFLKKKYLGVTEYIAKKTKSKNQVMLIYNDKLSVSPLTTHLPLKKIFKKITQKKMIKNIITINNFFKFHLKKKAHIGVTGLNPHCESTERVSEEKKVLEPAITKLKKLGIKISGPFPADTVFMKKNLRKFNIIFGMYHDQVLTPIKTLYEFDAINITLGLPFLRITPDHGTNNQMLGKNLSNPTSLIKAILFTKNIK